MSDVWEKLELVKTKLEHLNLKDQIHDIHPVPMKTIGGSCDILAGVCNLDGRQMKVAIKRLRFFVSKEREFAKVRNDDNNASRVELRLTQLFRNLQARCISGRRRSTNISFHS